MNKERTYTITFAGDTSLSKGYLNRSKNEKSIDQIDNETCSHFSQVKSLVDDSDYFILNLETSLESNPINITKNRPLPNYDDPRRTLKLLKELGVTAVSLANNHTMNFGDDVLLKTIKQLKREKIKSFGAGKNIKRASKPHKITLKGRKGKQEVYILSGMRASKKYRDLGFFAMERKPGVNNLQKTKLSKQISRLREKKPNAIIIVFPHWQGQDYKQIVNHQRIQERCKSFIDAGANYIIGHGTHILSDIEQYSGGTIIYSIGDFVFTSPKKYKKKKLTSYSSILKLEFKEDKDGLWNVNNKIYPIRSANQSVDYNIKPIIDNGEALYFNIPNTEPDKHRKYDVLSELNINNPKSDDIKRTKRIYNIELIEKEFNIRGIRTEYLNSYLIAQINDEKVYFKSARPSTDSNIGTTIAKNKKTSKQLLQNKGLSVAKGKEFSKHEKNDAMHFAKNFDSVILKPIEGNKGLGVFGGITNKEQFSDAWDDCIKIAKGDILVEKEFINAQEIRYLVVGGKYVASVLRIPPKIIGDGKNTIKELIIEKNKQRALNPNLVDKLIKLDRHRISIIKQQGYDLQDVLEKNKEILIDSKAGLSTGGESMDMTDEIHETFKHIAEKAAKAVPGIDVVGVDILAENHLNPANDDNYIILEVNTQPGLGGHTFPSHGNPRNVAKEIVEFIINKVQNN